MQFETHHPPYPHTLFLACTTSSFLLIGFAFLIDCAGLRIDPIIGPVQRKVQTIYGLCVPAWNQVSV